MDHISMTNSTAQPLTGMNHSMGRPDNIKALEVVPHRVVEVGDIKIIEVAMAAGRTGIVGLNLHP